MKKIVSMLLSLILIISVVPMEVCASGTEIVNYGECGDNLTWELNSKGVLKIKGSGPMDDYFGWFEVPWEYEGQDIKRIIIGKNVTSIGCYAFTGCLTLKTIDIPQKVIKIGYCAFGACESLKNIYYSGTKEQWNKINIDVHDNTPLYRATLQCKSTGKNTAELKTPKFTFKTQKGKLKIKYKKVPDATGFVIKYKKASSKKWITKTYKTKKTATKTIKKLSKGKYKIKAYAFVKEGKKIAKSKVISRTVKIK